jgi:hypothetical protein
MFKPPALTYDEIDERMDHHPPTSPATGDAHATVRLIAKAALKALKDIVPPGREASLMATAAQEMLMWANAGIACNGGPRDGVGMDELAEIRTDFNIEYGSRRDVPTDGGPMVTDAEGRAIPGLDTQV